LLFCPQAKRLLPAHQASAFAACVSISKFVITVKKYVITNVAFAKIGRIWGFEPVKNCGKPCRNTVQTLPIPAGLFLQPNLTDWKSR
jgi:hypothetical protein